jgi:hypothetical protein
VFELRLERVQQRDCRIVHLSGNGTF